MTRLGLAAALLLLLVPTAGRLAQAGTSGGHAAHHAHATHAELRHAEGAQHRSLDDQRKASGTPTADDADCHYCALLASLVAIPHAALPAAPAGAGAAARSRSEVRLPWLHPNGLGSRGPPLRG